MREKTGAKQKEGKKNQRSLEHEDFQHIFFKEQTYSYILFSSCVCVTPKESVNEEIKLHF